MTHSPSFQPSLKQRFIYLWWLKAILTTGAMFGFFELYFYLLNNPAYPVHTVPATMVDDLINFMPAWFWVYTSLWLYTSLPASVLWFRDEIRGYSVGMLTVCALGLLIFYAYPTTIPAQVLNDTNSLAYRLLKSMDASGNASPSLHVATAVFAGLWFEGVLRRLSANQLFFWFNRAWCVAIVFSTLAVKQHVLIDVLSGALLGLLVLCFFRLPRDV
ncbi:MAG: phosphatase PAP2 family protein [Formosimonas sp.]|jgi:membrane-associated phospholipid phosphatase